MNRNRFILALLGAFGVARAQKPCETTPNGITCGNAVTNQTQPQVLGPSWAAGKVMAGQCPVCGLVAVPFVRPTRETGSILIPCDPPAPKDSNIACMERHVEPYGPTEQLTRCQRCNCAFFQDAEK